MIARGGRSLEVLADFRDYLSQLSQLNGLYVQAL